MSAIGEIGFYGKLPVNGDFVSRGLPHHFISAWDQWLQNGLQESQQQLGEQWLDYYLTCPVLRFYLCPGVIDQQSWFGVLMSSVDKVGRYFPLTLALTAETPTLINQLFSEKVDFFDKLEHIALGALDENYQLETFEQSLNNLTLPDLANTCDAARESHRLMLINFENSLLAEQVSPKLSLQINEKILATYSVWQNPGSEHIQPSIACYHGLPTAADFSDMIRCE